MDGTDAPARLATASELDAQRSPGPAPHVAQEIERLMSLADDLDANISDITNRFDVVLMPRRDVSAAQDGATPAPVQSTLATSIAALNDRVYAAIVRIRELRDRADF